MEPRSNRCGFLLPLSHDVCAPTPGRHTLWRLAAATVVLVAFESGAEANHCPADWGSRCCWKTVPDPHPHADQGFFWICDYPDNCHYRCEQSQGDDVANACKASGSVLDLDNQALSEAIGIVGTPFKLRYYSDRVPG